MTRERLISALRSVHGVTNDNALMDILQLQLGLVSDCAVTIDDVCNRDLLRAYNRCVQGAQEAA